MYQARDNRMRLTHIVHAPFVRVLTSRLVLIQRKQELFPKRRVGIEEERPGWEYDVDGVDVLRRGSIMLFENERA